MTVLKHAAKYPRSTLGIILAHKHCPINSIIPTFSFQTLVKNIFRNSEYRKAYFIIATCNSDLLKIIVDPLLVEKMYSLVNSFYSIFPKTSCFTKKKYKQLLIPLITLSKNNKTIFSFHFKRLNKANQYTVHPSISTRRRDGLYFPDVDIFNKSLPIFVHYKNFLLEFISTLPSKNKLYKFKIVESKNLFQHQHDVDIGLNRS